MRERVPVNKEETAEDRLLNFVEEQTNKFTKYTSLAYSGSGPVIKFSQNIIHISP